MDPVRRDAVVIIDDDPAVLDSLDFLLQSAGYAVRAYESAAAFLVAGLDDAACLVVDQQMPGMTGLDLIAHLRAEALATPALLVSSALTPSLQDRAARLGVATLAKPLEEDGLLRFVATHAAAAP